MRYHRKEVGLHARRVADRGDVARNHQREPRARSHCMGWSGPLRSPFLLGQWDGGDAQADRARGALDRQIDLDIGQRALVLQSSLNLAQSLEISLWLLFGAAEQFREFHAGDLLRAMSKHL